jgi:hypothetical protein
MGKRKRNLIKSSTSVWERKIINYKLGEIIDRLVVGFGPWKRKVCLGSFLAYLFI